jgi:hypothetical protein
MLLCTVSAAINFSALLDAMSHNSAITMGAGWRHCMNRAFKAVEGHRSILHDLERLVVFIAAIVAFSHIRSPWRRPRLWKHGHSDKWIITLGDAARRKLFASRQKTS